MTAARHSFVSLRRALHVLAGMLVVVLSVGAAEPSGYYDRIKPILAVHCHKCHAAETQKSGLRLDLAQVALAGGKSGKPAIAPGAAAQSELVRRITSRDPEEQMPPKGPRLADDEVTLIRQWIDAGAKWPERDDFWAFQPPADLPVPAATENPIDAFINAKLAAAKIAPAASADSRTLLRRAFADLIGMPPSPDEAENFLSDKSPDAFEKLVDRLLVDHRCGERRARHWLDLARYGESDGYEDDKIRPHAWRYRDYVIRSFNADKPYDRFVQEQIAGDELWPDDPDAWIATGFARLGAWDGMSKEPAQQRQDFLNDATDAAGAVFLGVTLGCARCHDHKFDPVTQRDYYALQAFFAGVKRETREMKFRIEEPEPVTIAHRTDKASLERLKTGKDELLKMARQELEKEKLSKIDDAKVTKKAETLQPGRIGELDKEIKATEKRMRFHAPSVEVVFRDGSPPPKLHVLKGGELSRPGEEVAPGFPGIMMSPGAPVAAPSGSRAELARWLTSAENPLTARVIVNRLWQHHFGAGLVATPSDFGRNGRPPVHPELLDWLARRFVRDGFSLRKMHRLIMTSAAWRRSSGPDAAASSLDPENKLLWRMNRRRLEGEAVRDTILAVSGSLNPAMGGPGVYAPLPKGVNVEFPNNDKELSWGTASDDEGRRRSVYLFQRRSLTYPLMEVFDAAPMNQSCAARPQTTVAPQALALFNGEFTRHAASCFAARLQKDAGADASKQITRAFQLAFTRPPSVSELDAALRFLREQSAPRNAAGDAALVDFCHALLNANELIYAD